MKILKTAAIYDPTELIENQFTRLTPKFVDFSNGLLLDEFDGLDLETYDPVYFSKQAGFSTPIPADLDIAVVKNKEKLGRYTYLRTKITNLKRLFYLFEVMVSGERYLGTLQLIKI